MSTLIRTAEVPAADRKDFVREMAADTWVPMEFHYDCDCWGEFRASGMGPMQVVVMDIMPITVRRTPPLIAQADPRPAEGVSGVRRQLERGRPGWPTGRALGG